MPLHYGPDRIEGPLLEVPNQAENVAILTFCTTDFVVKFFYGPFLWEGHSQALVMSISISNPTSLA